MKLLMTKLSRWKVDHRFFLLYCLFFMTTIGLANSSNTENGQTLCPVLCTCNKSSGIVNCSNKGFKEIPANIPPWVITLSLRTNKLTSDGLKKFDFSTLPHLQKLDLSNNKIQNLNADFSATYLQEIILDHCALTTVPDIRSGSSIVFLSLSHNSISDLGSSLQQFPDLVHLDLSFNKIRNLGENVFSKQRKLKILLLQKNRIPSLDWKSFSGLVSIESIDLSRSRIQNIVRNSAASKASAKQQNCTGNLVNLKSIDLSRNRLSEILGLAFSGMCGLTSLQLHTNRITKLSDGAFYGLKNLKTLNLDHNKINAVSRGWLYRLSSLQTLSVAFNNISEVESRGWEFCKELVHLNLSNNYLPYLHANGFSQLVKLKTLKLDNNKITVIEENAFSGLSQLTTLNISFNEISNSFEDISEAFLGLSSLESLLLRHNKIRTLSSSVLEGLENVQTLDLRENDVTSIQNHTFDHMVNLRSLEIISSSFLCDCQLAWFPSWLDLMSTTREGFSSNIQGSCFHPPELVGRDILEIQQSEFVCGTHPIPVLLQEPSSRSALVGENVTLECSASATFVDGTTKSTLTPKSQDAPVGNEPPNPVNTSPRTNPARDSFLSLQSEVVEEVEEERKDKMEITWRRGQEVIRGNERITIQDQSLRDAGDVYFTSKMTLSSVTSGDNGLYSCIISNGFGHARSKEVQLEVNEFPRFIKIPMNVTIVRNGSEAILDCSATGQPSPQITWQKDGGKNFPAATDRRLRREQTKLRKIPKIDDRDEAPSNGLGLKSPLSAGIPKAESTQNNPKELFMVDTDAPLHIGVVLPEDTGEYECVVQSSVGRIVAKAMLIVEVAPVFAKPIEPVTKAVLNKNVVMRCSIQANPSPKIEWKFNGEKLNVTSRHYITGEGQVLVITETRFGDAGEYSCEAKNHLGSVTGKTKLKVYEKASQLETSENFLTLIFGGDTTTGIIVVIVAVFALTSLVWLCIFCYNRKNHEKAFSTNTDATELPQDVHSYSSTDESTRKSRSTDSIHYLGNGVTSRDINRKESNRLPYGGSVSACDVRLMQIQQTPSERHRLVSGSSNHIVRSFPGQCQSSVNHEKPSMKRFRSEDNFRMGGNLPLHLQTPQKRGQCNGGPSPNQPVVSPSSYFAKKAATQDTYIPVHLKTQVNSTPQNENKKASDNAQETPNRSKKLKKVKVRNQRKQKQHKQEQNTQRGSTQSQEEVESSCSEQNQPILHNGQPFQGRDLSRTAESVKFVKEEGENAESWRSYYYRDRRKGDAPVAAKSPQLLTPQNPSNVSSIFTSGVANPRPPEISSDSLAPTSFSSENTLVSESSGLLSSENISAEGDSIAPSRDREYDHLLNP